MVYYGMEYVWLMLMLESLTIMSVLQMKNIFHLSFSTPTWLLCVWSVNVIKKEIEWVDMLVSISESMGRG